VAVVFDVDVVVDVDVDVVVATIAFAKLIDFGRLRFFATPSDDGSELVERME
jgi:hypothetical protein